MHQAQHFYGPLSPHRTPEGWYQPISQVETQTQTEAACPRALDSQPCDQPGFEPGSA